MSWADAEQESARALRAARSTRRRHAFQRVLLRGLVAVRRARRPDRVIGAFEHFGFDRYDAFFKIAYDLCPPTA